MNGIGVIETAGKLDHHLSTPYFRGDVWLRRKPDIGYSDKRRFMDRLIEEHREEIRRLAVMRGARRVRIFGSRARGDAGCYVVRPSSREKVPVDSSMARGRCSFLSEIG